MMAAVMVRYGDVPLQRQGLIGFLLLRQLAQKGGCRRNGGGVRRLDGRR